MCRRSLSVGRVDPCRERERERWSVEMRAKDYLSLRRSLLPYLGGKNAGNLAAADPRVSFRSSVLRAR